MGVNGIYGLSGSGLDIESLVKMGMSGKNKQYDKMEQQEIANTWLKEAYNDVYNDLTTYKYGTLSDYKMQSNMNAMQATSSNSSVVTATANGAAAAMNHQVEVSSVASNAYLMTTQQKDDQGHVIKTYGVDRANEKASTSNKLADVLFQSYKVDTATQSDNNWNFKYEITKSDGTTAVVNGSDVAISLKIKDTAGKDAKTYTLSYTYDELFTGCASDTYTGYTGDGSSVFDGGKTLNDFASAFAKTGANIQGGYDTANDSFSLYNKTSGESNVIDIAVENDTTATLFNHLNLGAYHADTGVLDDRIEFAIPTVEPTTIESVNLNTSITSSAQSVSLMDVLGLKATVDGDNTIVTQVNSKGEVQSTVGTFTDASDKVFSLQLSNGTSSATISFTLGELFNNNAGLDELASKINATGLGITASYDAIKDSFSLSNPNGQANLTAVAGTGESTATQLINSLNLATSSSLTYLTTNKSGILADVFGLKATFERTDPNSDSYALRVKDTNNNVLFTQEGTKADFTSGEAKTSRMDAVLSTLQISDGTNSATVNITFGDIVSYAAIRDSGSGSAYVTQPNGVEARTGANFGEIEVMPSSKAMSDLAAKIKTAISDAHVNITAEYDNGTLSFLNLNGPVTITTPAGSKVDASAKLNLQSVDPSTMAYKTSSSITRVNANSTEDSLAAAVGLTAVKKDVNTLTIKKSDGTSEDVATTATAISFKVGNGTNETEVSLTYAELFDTTGSGTLKGKADFSTLVSKINEKTSSTNVTATYTNGKFSLTNTAGDATLTGVDDLAGALVSKMGLTETAASIANKEEKGQLHRWKGTDASVTIDGKEYKNDTNKLTVAGVTYTFLDSTAGSKATISVSQDTDKIVDYVKSFVEDYNKLLDSLNEKLSEKKYSDYKPLSKRQEEEMTEKQIDKWNEKAKSGLLYHNSTIRDLVSAMREAIYTRVDAVDSEYNSLSAIGITTTNTKGQLTLDTDKLRKALAADPDCVYQLFASDQDSSYIAGSTDKNKITDSQKKEDYANTGVSNRLYNVMTNYMSKISDIAGTSKETDDQSYLGKMITDMKTRMSNFKTQMTAYENKLFKRYDAMEVALSRISAQLSYITNSFS
ncbi:flagellar filament capping protein FliD [uncultured Anaerovibrio sp.]|uniref:flagellar filament capping protein FliD n=1 Tax=uncultured Anaerovibrio sp. TaxID=361586 RepID=UPI0025F8A14F|nr:flagellar filament capping protein FliD [uncultured Anaerovibrio sp.]